MFYLLDTEVTQEHYVNVRRLTNATLHHYSKSSKHSGKLPRKQLSYIMIILETLANASLIAAVREFRLKHANIENVLYNRGLTHANQQR